MEHPKLFVVCSEISERTSHSGVALCVCNCYYIYAMEIDLDIIVSQVIILHFLPGSYKSGLVVALIQDCHILSYLSVKSLDPRLGYSL